MNINFKKIFESLLPMLIINILAFLLFFYMFDPIDLRILLILICFCLFTSFIPTIYLFLNYYKVNRHIKVFFHTNEIELIKQNNFKTITIDEIKQFDFHGPKNKLDNSHIMFSTFNEFYYVKITLKKGDVVYITSLISDNLNKILPHKYPNVVIFYNYTIFPIIKF